MTAKWINNFNARLDELLGLVSRPSKLDDPQSNAALQAADMLSKLDFDSEISPQAEIQSRWAHQTQKSKPTLRFHSGQARRLLVFRYIWASILILLIAL